MDLFKIIGFVQRLRPHIVKIAVGLSAAGAGLYGILEALGGTGASP